MARFFSKQHRKNLSLALKGKLKSEKHIKNIRKSKEKIKGKTYEELYGKEKAKLMKEKISKRVKGKNNPMYGKTHTKETRKKIIEAQLGRTSQTKGKTLEELYGVERAREIKQKNRIAHKGKKLSEETKKKLSLVGKGRIFSKQHKKKMSEKAKLRIGEKNPAWKGGKSFEPYGFEFDEKLKKVIRQRDKFVCQICRKNGFCVHHIDYNKKNNNPNNLITLCRICHGYTNHDREKWRNFFNGIKQKI